MRIFIIVRRQPERFSQGAPRYDHGDRTQEEERRFWSSLDHRIAVVRTDPHGTARKIVCVLFYAKEKSSTTTGSGQGSVARGRMLSDVLTFAF